MSAASPGAERWLHGPARDLLLGCGLLYALAFVVFAFVGREIRLAQPAVLLPLIMLLTATPHYGATLIRVYEHRDDRRAYAFYAVWVTLALCLLFVAGVYDDWVASALLTVYLTWSPWHYTGQNYGIAMMFLGRAGVAADRDTRRWLHASFVLSFVLTALVMHTAGGHVTDSMVSYDGSSVRFLVLGIPRAAARVLVGAAGLAYLAATAIAAIRLLRHARPSALAPTAALVLSQALWFSIPLAARFWSLQTGLEPVDDQVRVHYFLWIAVAHAIQYLWITSYFARRSPGYTGFPRYYAKALLAGNAAWALPVLLFTPDGIGRLSYDAGLALLTASLVNLHHFLLDGAIWKLRSARVGDVLVRSQSLSAEAARTGPATRRPGAWLAWAAVALLVVASFAAVIELLVRQPAAMRRGDPAVAAASLDRLAWIGRDDARRRALVGDAFARDGLHQEALEQYARSIRLRPSARAYDAVGQLFAREQRWPDAIPWYEQALALDGERPGTLARLGRALVESGELERGRALLERALSLDPEQGAAQRGLAREAELRGSDADTPAVVY